MKLRVHLLVFCSLACALPAWAQSNGNSINLHSTYMPSDDRGFYMVEGARTLSAGEIYAGIDFSHAHNPLELGFPGDSRARSVVRQLSMLDVALGFGIRDDLSLSVVLPVVLDNDGRELNQPDFFRDDTRSGGIGALRARLKWTVYDSREHDPRGLDEPEDSIEFALALSPFLTLPTGRARDYLSDQNNPTGGGSLFAEVEFFRRVRIGGTIGVELLSSSPDIGDLEIEDRARYGLAVEVFLFRERSGQDVPERLSEREESPSEQRRIYRILALLATVDGEVSDAERAFLEDLAEGFELDPAARQALSAEGTLETLRQIETLEVPFERARLEEALRSFLPLDEFDDSERQAYEVLAEVQELAPELSPAESGGWRERADLRVPIEVLEPARQSEGNAHTLSVGAELFGWTDTGNLFHNERKHSSEIGGYLRYQHRSGFGLRAGISSGLTNGLGTPDVRYYAGVGYRF